MAALPPLAAAASPETTDRARQFVKDHEARLRPLDTAANLAWWNANTTGKDEDFDRKNKAQNRIDEALSDPKRFAEFKDLKDHRKDIDDPIAGPGHRRALPRLPGKAGRSATCSRR